MILHVVNACLIPQTRHDHDLLDRKSGAGPLGDDFTYYIGLPDEETFSLPDARYCPALLAIRFAGRLTKALKKLTLWMTGAPNEWDLYARQFRAAVQSYRLKRQC
ncbi:hypothetical protein ACP0HM_28160 [Escherichia coli]